MKICKECKKELDESWYTPQIKNGVVYHSSRCRPCHYQYYAKPIRVKLQHSVYEYLSTHPCVDCGESDIVLLEFDHISNNKSDSVSNLIRLGNVTNVWKEIEKCEVRCVSCHRYKTAFDNNWEILNYKKPT